MTPEELASNLAADPKFRWLPGMREVTTGFRVDDECDHPDRWNLEGPAIPDLADPATCGCVLALVREAWDDEWYCLEIAGEHRHYEDGGCIKGWYDKYTRQSYDTEIEALVAALAAASRNLT